MSISETPTSSNISETYKQNIVVKDHCDFNTNVCKICKQQNHYSHSAILLKKYKVNYFHCKHCGFLQTEEPHWLSEAYHHSINLTDIGYISRNIDLSKKLPLYILLFFNKRNQYLDYAGGYGVFVRMMRDIGFDFYWDDRYTENLFAQGFEYKNQKIEAITSFESFEHFPDPISEIEKLLEISKNIILSTETLPSSVPLPEEWEYYGLDHGQHISFYSTKTFEYIARQYNLHYHFMDGLHFLTETKLRSFTIFFKIKKIMLRFALKNRSLKKRILHSKISEDYNMMKQIS